MLSGTPATILTRSRARSLAVRTREAPPAAPSAFAPSDARPNELTFAWRLPPADRHGVLRRFALAYWPRDRPDHLRTLHFPPDGRYCATLRRTAPHHTAHCALTRPLWQRAAAAWRGWCRA